MAQQLYLIEKGPMHATGQDAPLEVALPTDPAEARRFQDEIERALKTHGFDERDIFSIKLALEEALVNAMKHGNQMDRTKKVFVSYRIGPDKFEVNIEDEGKGFDPEDVPDPVAFENLERPCGRGLLLMRHYMNEVVFHPPGNRLFMTKLRSAKPSANGRK